MGLYLKNIHVLILKLLRDELLFLCVQIIGNLIPPFEVLRQFSRNTGSMAIDNSYSKKKIKAFRQKPCTL